ncbi:MAG: O-acetyl-ADP-ribose deacetylase [Kiloniellales bacterium]|nr:O-acetyl-ADP-ribose deacetylase [Kiloniellales bacterium]MDJ0983109.1 O-acetyl-ADP-ribose deacetylase [Kiloniellales bacterium]
MPSDDRLEIFQGDITALDVDAIVNAANSHLEPGGGVCGAIHRAAGPELARACRTLGGCPTGEARITPGFDLAAGHVIHAVGPTWRGGDEGEETALAGAYQSSLALAKEQGLASIAFPAISTGIYGFPLDRATEIAVATCRDHLKGETSLGRIVFAVFGTEAEEAYRRALGR